MKPVLPSVFLSPDAVQTQTAKLMGRQSAGRGFMRGLAAAYSDDDRSLVLVHGGGSQQAVLEIEARDTGWVRSIEHRRVQEPSTWPGGRLLYTPMFNATHPPRVTRLDFEHGLLRASTMHQHQTAVVITVSSSQATHEPPAR